MAASQNIHCSVTRCVIDLIYDLHKSISDEKNDIESKTYKQEDCRYCSPKGREDFYNIINEIIKVLKAIVDLVLSHENSPNTANTIDEEFQTCPTDEQIPTKLCENVSKINNLLLGAKRQLAVNHADLEYHMDTGDGCVVARRQYEADEILTLSSKFCKKLNKLKKSIMDHQSSCHKKARSTADSGIVMEGPPYAHEKPNPQFLIRRNAIYEETGNSLKIDKDETAPKSWEP